MLKKTGLWEIDCNRSPLIVSPDSNHFAPYLHALKSILNDYG